MSVKSYSSLHPARFLSPCRARTICRPNSGVFGKKRPLQSAKGLVKAIMKRLCILLIRVYQRMLSPLFPPSCRFTPTCSQYAIDAISFHGPGKGLLLSLARILRCHPFCRGGYDPAIPDHALHRHKSTN